MDSPAETKGDRKILVYLIGSLGDTIVAIPALRAIRKHYQNAEIVLLQNAQGNGIVSASEVIPEALIDRFLSYKSNPGLSGVLSYAGLWKKLRSERFDAAVNLVISERPEKSVIRDRLFFRACGIKELVGFKPFGPAELYPTDANGKPAMTNHEALRKLERLEHDGITTDRDRILSIPFFEFSRSETKEMRDRLESFISKNGAKIVAIAPGCKTQSNLWPSDNFVRLSDHLVSKGFQILIVGGPNEKDLGAEIVEKLGSGYNTAGKFSVKESAIVLSLCDLYIGLDTGSTHLASAVGTPCFAIFGERNNPGHWFPLGQRLVISHPVECSGCRQVECPVAGHPCMREMSVQTVINHLDRFIASDFGRELTEEEKFVTI